MTSEQKEGRVTHPASRKAAAATPQARRHLSPADRLPVQLSLLGEPTEPADLMFPPRAWSSAEVDLKRTVNTRRRRRELEDNRRHLHDPVPRYGRSLCAAHGNNSADLECTCSTYRWAP